jgi:L-malate glycosyltransferase
MHGLIMRVMILTPSAFPDLTGNAVTSERWRRSLERQGLTVKVLATQGLDTQSFYKEISSFRPDIIQGLHALKTGELLLRYKEVFASDSVPFVVSFAGTDINHDIKYNDKKSIILNVCKMSQAIIAQSHDIVTRLKALLPDLNNRIFYIQASLSWFGNTPFDLRGAAGCEGQHVLFFLPAGIRPVKGNLECLTALREVHKIRPLIKAVFAGPVLDVEYASLFYLEMNQCSEFARLIPPIPPASMRAAYKGADVVLNASFSEGFSNALLEAMASGLPILASDIESNRFAVFGENVDQRCGYLFNPYDQIDFVSRALKLIDEPATRIALGEKGRAMAGQMPDADEEAALLVSIYRRVMSDVIL